MTRKQRRLTLIVAAGSVLAIAAAIVLTALEDTITFFKSPTDVAERNLDPNERFRLGGLVADGSVIRGDDGVVQFDVTDTANTVTVTYAGILPDLFREGQGIVTEGRLDPSGRFAADTVLAKHDENYMPPEVAEALKRQGHWQGETGEVETQ